MSCRNPCDRRRTQHVREHASTYARGTHSVGAASNHCALSCWLPSELRAGS